jgi:hypothetical protein
MDLFSGALVQVDRGGKLELGVFLACRLQERLEAYVLHAGKAAPRNHAAVHC